MRLLRLDRLAVASAFVTSLAAPTLQAQSYATSDQTVRKIWEEGMDRSQVARLGQVLSDSIGPRWTGSPGMKNITPEYSAKVLKELSTVHYKNLENN